MRFWKNIPHIFQEGTSVSMRGLSNYQKFGIGRAKAFLGTIMSRSKMVFCLYLSLFVKEDPNKGKGRK